MVIRRTSRSGFTLLEVVVSMAYFLVLTYILTSAIQMGHGAHRAVIEGARENSTRRASSDLLLAELKSANSDSIVVEVQADGNDQLTLALPIEVGGTLTWGASDWSLSKDPEECVKEGWTVRYRVESTADANGDITRQLVRQLVDQKGVVQLEDVQAVGLCNGEFNPRGFAVEPAGDMWEVTLTFESETEGGRGKSDSFHVRTRN